MFYFYKLCVCIVGWFEFRHTQVCIEMRFSAQNSVHGQGRACSKFARRKIRSHFFVRRTFQIVCVFPTIYFRWICLKAKRMLIGNRALIIRKLICIVWAGAVWLLPNVRDKKMKGIAEIFFNTWFLLNYVYFLVLFYTYWSEKL